MAARQMEAAASISLPTHIVELSGRVDRLKEHDQERQRLLDELLSVLRTTTEELSKATLDKESEMSARRSLQQKNAELSSKLAARPYVVLIIDADGYRFRCVNEGVSGGEQVADMLASSIKEAIKSQWKDIDGCDVIVEAYANVNGLGQAMVDLGEARTVDQLRLFYTGFVRRQPMFSVVDVGPGRERADQKIREKVEFNIRNLQCRQIYLACCHDEGYAAFLGQFVSTNKLTLILNGPCHPAIGSLGLRNQVFADLFAERSAAEKVARPSSMKINPFALQARLGPIKIDEKSGLRVDKVLPVMPTALRDMERSNLCYWFYLRGECRGCSRDHDPRRKLTIAEFDALWFVARRGVCVKSHKRVKCEDALCIYGHRT